MMNPGHLHVHRALAIQQAMNTNQVDALVLTPAQYMSLLQDKAKKNPAQAETLRKMLANSEFGKYWNTTLYPNVDEPAVIPLSQAATDVMLITRAV